MANRNVADDASNPNKATIADNDGFLIRDSESNPNSLKEVLFSLIKSTLAAATMTLTNKTLTTPTIADFTNAAHDHGDADDGGAVVSASATVAGVAELATDAEAIAKADTARTVTPSNLMAVLDLINFVPGGRLTLTTGTPVTTADVTGATSVYYTPYKHDSIMLWNGTYWQAISFAETTLALGTVTSGLPYDVFGYLNSGALALEKLAWTNGTTRATAITLQDGRYCKSGDKTRLYLGTLYTTSTTQTEDSASKRFLWNMYNRVERALSCVDATNTWEYTTATWRAANNNTTTGQGRVELCVGLAEDPLHAIHQGLAYNASAAGVATGIAIDATNTNHAQVYGGFADASGNQISCVYGGTVAAGYHYVQRTEISAAAGTTTWIGDNNVAFEQTGMVARIPA